MAETLVCEKCGYDGNEGWSLIAVGEDSHGDDIDGWLCPECGEVVCVAEDCPPDDFEPPAPTAGEDARAYGDEMDGLSDD